MAARIPDAYLDLFKKRAFAHLATVMPDGSPQVTPVWVDFDGEHLLVNSAKGRIKDRNMEARPEVALSIADPDDPYRYIAVRGRVTAIVEEGAREHIDRLAHNYTGAAFADYKPGMVRRIYKITPEHVLAAG